MENKPDCCHTEKSNKKKGLIQGLIYGTIPHIGCIGFIIFSLLGVTILSSVFKPLMMKAYFFYLMVGISLIFATFSAFLYLRKHDYDIKNNKGYLSILYGSTIAISLILYLFVFPLVSASVASTGNAVSGNSDLKIKVAIPCEGHASLITGEINKLTGINSVQFTSPNIFNINYDSSKTSQQEILGLEIFREYSPKIMN